MIPKIIHQTWRSRNLPELFQNIYEHNKTLNNDFEFKLWSHSPGEPDIDEFIKKEYNDIYHIFSRAKMGVQKADIARLVILYHYGGIYFDLDILCLKKLNTLIDFDTDYAYMALEPKEQCMKLFGNDNILCNAFIAVPPKHPLIKEAIESIKSLFLKNGDNIYNIFNIFGADMLSNSMKNTDIFSTCKFIKRELIYPINDPKFKDLPSSSNDVAMLKSGNYGDSYMVHYWIHSDFESKELLETFCYDNTKNVHQNIVTFFQKLYKENIHLRE